MIRSSAGTEPARSRAVAVWTILAVAIVTWLLSWRAPFAEDDYLFLDAMLDADVSTWVGYLGGEGVMDHHYRPLSDPLFFGVLLRGLGGHPLAYHILLTLAVAVSGVLIADLGRRVGLDARAAWAAGCLYVSRDFLFPSMVWASGVSDVGSTLWSLAFLDLHAAGFRPSGGGGRRGVRRRLLAALALVLALGTKETAIVSVALAFLVSWHLSPAFPTDAGRGPGDGLAARAATAARSIWPYVLVAIPFAIVQLSIARFESGAGAELYRLTPGLHTVTRWPVYAVWSLAGVRELADVPALRRTIAVAGYAALAALTWTALRSGRTSGGDRSAHEWSTLARFGVVWLIVSVSPALLAPSRFHTNYVGLGAAGVVWTVASALFPGRAPSRLVARTPVSLTVSPGRAAVFVLIVVLGMGLVVAKSMGRLESGGWVSLPKAERLDEHLHTLRTDLAPDPVPNATLVLFDALGDDVRVLGDPRRRGFGVQSTVASAVRFAYRRPDLEVLVYPPLEATAPEAFSVLYEIARAAPDRVHVIDLAGPPADLTDAARDVVNAGAGSSFLARRLTALRR